MFTLTVFMHLSILFNFNDSLESLFEVVIMSIEAKGFSMIFKFQLH